MRDTQDVPFSIGSYSTDTVQSQRARTALDVLKNDPSVSAVTYAASFDGVAVRGFSANTFNNVRRDGLLANVYADVPLENKERIDVLKGVSGFLYGVGDPSGLVNYVTKRPTRDHLLSVTGELRTQRATTPAWTPVAPSATAAWVTASMSPRKRSATSPTLAICSANLSAVPWISSLAATPCCNWTSTTRRRHSRPAPAWARGLMDHWYLPPASIRAR